MSNRYAVVMLREGAYRGVKPVGKSIRFSRRVLAEAAASMNDKPFKLNHDGADAAVAGAVVGRVRNVRFAHDAIVGEIELDPKAPAFKIAKAFFDATLALGGMPNVSVEADYTGKDDGAEVVVDSVTFTALSGVHRGACSDIAGCGVTAALSRGFSMDNTNATNVTADLAVTTTNSTATNGTVEFTIVPEAPAAPPVDAEKVALAADKASLEAKLAENDKALNALKAALADSEKALEIERAKVPVLVALAALAPSYPTEGKTLCELKAALDMAKLAPAPSGPVRHSLLAEPAPAPKTQYELLVERMSKL